MAVQKMQIVMGDGVRNSQAVFHDFKTGDSPVKRAGDHTIVLSTTASVTEFLGYDQPTNTMVIHNSAGKKNKLPTVLPSFAVRKASAHVKLWDGQTVVMGGLKSHFYDGGKEVGAEPGYFVKTKIARGQPDEEDKEMLAFITATLVDPAGHRVHSDDETPFAKDAIPPQNGP